MNLLPKPLQAEVLYYTSDKSIEDLKSAAQQLIKESETLTGKFSSENEFYLYPTYLTSRKGLFFSYKESSAAILTGEIYTDNFACLKMSVEPSSSYKIIFYGICFFVIVDLLSSFNSNILDLWNSFDLLYPLLLILIYYYLKRWLINKVTKELALTPML